VATGPTSQVEAEATSPEVVDLGGRTVLPGFNDAHTHIFSVGIQLIETDLSSSDTREEAVSLLEDNAERTNEGEWVLGFGYDESTWPEGERDYLSLAELDAVSEDHPIIATRVDGHTSSLNSLAMKQINFEGVEHDVITEGGEATGRVVEDAAGQARAASYPGVEKAQRALDAAIEHVYRLGITSVQTMAGLTRVREHGNVQQEALFRTWREGGLDLRVTFYAPSWQAESLSDLELTSGFGDEYLRIGGLKTFSDGSIGSQTAKLYGDFADDPGNRGQMVNDGDQLEAWYRHAARTNQQIATHAIGGRAIDTVLDRYEAVLGEYDFDARLRIEHVELATDEALARMAEHGIVASMQPNFLQWSEPSGLYETRLGEETLATNNRFRDVLDADIPLAFGSDKMPPGPLYGIDYAVNTEHEAQCLTVDEAIAACTRGAAYAEFTETQKGTLESGMLGDAVVLERDPHDHPGDVADIDVIMTVLDGDIVYDAR
jgi:predicted amidohydrolase YtcJ